MLTQTSEDTGCVVLGSADHYFQILSVNICRTFLEDLCDDGIIQAGMVMLQDLFPNQQRTLMNAVLLGEHPLRIRLLVHNAKQIHGAVADITQHVDTAKLVQLFCHSGKALGIDLSTNNAYEYGYDYIAERKRPVRYRKANKNIAINQQAEQVLLDILPPPPEEIEDTRKMLKREATKEAVRRAEEAARTQEDFKKVVSLWDNLNRNRERRERYHEILRGPVPIESGVDLYDAMIFPEWRTAPEERQLSNVQSAAPGGSRGGGQRQLGAANGSAV